MWAGRLALYLAGLAAGGLVMSGLATFDPATWELDILPFNVKDFALTAITMAGNALAAVAVWRGWRK